MRILVLGSLGFIGSSLVSSLLHNGYEVTGCDLVDSVQKYKYYKMSVLSGDFDTLLKDYQFDFCINASGNGNVSYSFSNTYTDFEANTVSIAKVLNVIARYQESCKFIHLSSAAVYGNPLSLPITENAEISPLSPYGFHKMISEEICREYYQLFKIPIVIIRPFSVYGNGLRKQLLWDLCTKLQEGNEVSLFGTGNETRDFIHIKDLVQIIMLLIHSGNYNCTIYNAANGIETRIKEISSICIKYFPEIKQVHFNGQVKIGDPVMWKADIKKINSLGYIQSITLDNGITEYINWFKNTLSL